MPPSAADGEFDRYAFPQLGPGRAGASSALVGYAWGGTALVEIPVFAITAKLLRRHRPEQLLITAGLINTLRMFLFAFTPNPWLLVFIHAIEGLAFPLITVGLVLLIDELVKPEFKTTGFTLQAALQPYPCRGSWAASGEAGLWIFSGEQGCSSSVLP